MFVFATVASAYTAPSAFAAGQITPRQLTLQAVGTVGGSTPGGVVNHSYAFTLPAGGSVGSIKFLYCTTANNASSDYTNNTCVAPTGMSVTGGTLGTQTGAAGFSGTFGGTYSNNDAGATSRVNGFYITRTAAAITAGQAVTYLVQNITNPTTVSNDATSAGTFFVRISTYTSTNATGSPLEAGTVAASTANQLLLQGVMPESLIFCTGQTVNASCTAVTAGNILFGTLFSATTTAVATSQMAASTNALSGYIITVNGATLSNGGGGSNPITAMAGAASAVNNSQFGMNLKLNATPVVGTEVAPAANGTTLRGQAKGAYATADSFKFVTGDTVAASDNGSAGPTNGQVFTASYIVNVTGNQAPGTYTTTLTYICTPQF